MKKKSITDTTSNEVLNTRGGGTDVESVDVSVLLSDYAKIRAIARDTRKTTMAVVEKTLINGIRNLSRAALAVTVFLFATRARAGLFSSDDVEKPAMRERQVGLFGSAKMADYKAESAALANCEEDVRALERMAAEKDARHAEIGRELESRYGMTLSQNYNYSEKDLTIYLVVTNGAFGSSPEKPVLRAHRAFIDAEEASGFVETVAERRSVAADASALRRFLALKRSDLAERRAAMRERYGVVQGKQYRLDEETGMFFELMPLPSEAELKAMREAQERAAIEAKERARIQAEAEEKAEREAREAKRKAEIAKRDAERKAVRDARIAREKAEREEEARRREEEARAREEKKRLEAEAEAREREARERAKAEKMRLEAEREARKKAEREAAVRAKAERKRLEAEREARKKAEREAAVRAKAEKKRLEAEAEAREREASERAKAEKKRLEAEREAREKAEREAAEKAANDEKERRRLEAEAKREAERKAKKEAEARARAARDASNW